MHEDGSSGGSRGRCCPLPWALALLGWPGGEEGRVPAPAGGRRRPRSRSALSNKPSRVAAPQPVQCRDAGCACCEAPPSKPLLGGASARDPAPASQRGRQGWHCRLPASPSWPSVTACPSFPYHSSRPPCAATYTGPGPLVRAPAEGRTPGVAQTTEKAHESSGREARTILSGGARQGAGSPFPGLTEGQHSPGPGLSSRSEAGCRASLVVCSEQGFSSGWAASTPSLPARTVRAAASLCLASRSLACGVLGVPLSTRSPPGWQLPRGPPSPWSRPSTNGVLFPRQSDTLTCDPKLWFFLCPHPRLLIFMWLFAAVRLSPHPRCGS